MSQHTISNILLAILHSCQQNYEIFIWKSRAKSTLVCLEI